MTKTDGLLITPDGPTFDGEPCEVQLKGTRYHFVKLPLPLHHTRYPYAFQVDALNRELYFIDALGRFETNIGRRLEPVPPEPVEVFVNVHKDGAVVQSHVTLKSALHWAGKSCRGTFAFKIDPRTGNPIHGSTIRWIPLDKS